MSVTITAEGSPTTKERLDCMCYEERGAEKDCPECQGKGFVEFDHYQYELQNSNTNFYSLMSVLGMGDVECCGALAGEQLTKLRSKILLARNSVRMRKNGVRSTTVEGNMTMCGLSDEDLTERLKKLEEIIVWAQANNKCITWG